MRFQGALDVLLQPLAGDLKSVYVGRAKRKEETRPVQPGNFRGLFLRVALSQKSGTSLGVLDTAELFQ
jgi:hypothetical protein